MLTPAVEMSRINGDKLLILLALRIFDTAHNSLKTSHIPSPDNAMNLPVGDDCNARRAFEIQTMHIASSEFPQRSNLRSGYEPDALGVLIRLHRLEVTVLLLKIALAKAFIIKDASELN